MGAVAGKDGRARDMNAQRHAHIFILIPSFIIQHILEDMRVYVKQFGDLREKFKASPNALCVVLRRLGRGVLARVRRRAEGWEAR